MTTNQHRSSPALDPAHLHDLAPGGTTETVRLLRSGQLRKHVILLHTVVAEAGRACSDVDGALRDQLGLLTELHATHPRVVTDTLLHPHIGSWAVHCLKHLRESDPVDTCLRSDLGYLPALLVTAAYRAGRPLTVRIPARDGRIVLPALGVADLGGATPEREPATVTVDAFGIRLARGDREVTVPADPHTDGAGWRAIPLLRTDGDDGLRILLDDIDPYRDNGGNLKTSTVEASEVPTWQAALHDAWTMLRRDHPEFASGIHVGLRSLVPLRKGPHGNGASATSANAFGAIATSPPPTATALAVTLVHEFQHGKLNAILDLVTLHNPLPDARYYAPWRDDPRPLGALLHGVYAHVGVASFWRTHRGTVTGQESILSNVEFARWRDQTWDAVQQLVGSPELTEAGQRFVAALADSLDAWRREPIGDDASTVAGDVAADHEASWRMRNLYLDDQQAVALARDWCERRPAPTSATIESSRRTGDHRLRDSGSRLNLLYLALQSPDRFHGLCADPAALSTAYPDATAADAAFVRGEHEAAADGYRTEVVAMPERLEAWTGLALSLRRTGATDVGEVLASRPEVVAEAYRQIVRASGSNPAVEDLVTWLAPALR